MKRSHLSASLSLAAFEALILGIGQHSYRIQRGRGLVYYKKSNRRRKAALKADMTTKERLELRLAKKGRTP